MINWIVGPQLVGGILFLVGLIMQKLPPKKINYWYGYRTASSMKNQETWDEANRYSAGIMIKTGLIMLIIGIAIVLVLNYSLADAQKWEGLIVGATVVTGILPAVIVIVKTESHLDKTFNNNNEIR